MITLKQYTFIAFSEPNSYIKPVEDARDIEPL